MVWLGKKVFIYTHETAPKYAGNGLNCVNCHLDRGRLASSAPLWGAWPMYPAYRGKNDKVNTMTDRIQGCFTFSMNGTPPQADSEVMVALLTYSYWLAQGAPTGIELP
ncbi:MAG: cytochrome C, partial [Nitrococcus sp.]|nr:cytochrome C [Nitrococcus sp.]